MDKLDKDIIVALNADGRASYREIARKTKISIATVAKRIKHLEATGTIRGYAPILDAEKLGYEFSAAIFVRITPGKLLFLEKKLSSDKRVSQVYDITGGWDALVMGRFKSRADLNKFIKKLLATEHVLRTSTSLVLNIVKEEFRIDP